MTRSIFEQAGRWQNSLRHQGFTLPISDTLIAATAHHYDQTILTLDSHFEAIEQVKEHRLP